MHHYHHLLFIFGLVTFSPYANAQYQTGRKVTHPRQIRADHIQFNKSNPRDQKIFKYVVTWLHDNERRLVDYDQPCDMALHDKWAHPGRVGNLTSSSTTSSFNLNTEWHGKICNFFKYMDCIDGRCLCPKLPNQFGLDLVHDLEDGVVHYNAPHRVHLVFKRRCRAAKDEICNFIRIETDRNESFNDEPSRYSARRGFPGVRISLADFIECENGLDCDERVEVEKLPNSNENMVSQKCQLPKTKSGGMSSNYIVNFNNVLLLAFLLLAIALFTK